MALRFVEPVAPYELPAGLDVNPPVPVAFDPASPSTEIIQKGKQFVHVSTKSTLNQATAYEVSNACGDKYYIKANVASNINKLIDCAIVSVFQGSLSVTVPRDIDAASVAVFVTSLVDALMEEILDVAAT